jgi:hypothetical protein
MGSRETTHQECEREKSSIPRGPQATAQDQMNCNSCYFAVAMLMFAASLFIPFLWKHELSDSNSYDPEVIRGTLEIERTWEGLQHDTLQNFREGFSSTTLPNYFVESLRGFENIFFEEDSLHSLGDFLELTGNENVTTSSWSIPLKQTHFKPAGTPSTRTISYWHPVSNPLAPPMARAIKTQHLERYHRDAAVIKTWTVVQDVPMADCFVVEERIFVESTGNNDVMFSAYFQIQFTKPTIFRSIIEQQTSVEFVEYFRNYHSFLMAVATRQQHLWQPTNDNVNDRSMQETGANSSLYSKKKLAKLVETALLRPIRMALRQLGTWARVLKNWQRSLAKKKEWMMM